MRYLILAVFTLCSLFLGAQPSGTLDASFGSGGKVLTPLLNLSKAYGVVIQPDGKIVVCGFQYSPSLGKDLVCLRYQSNGMLDSTFGNNGVAHVDAQLGSDDEARALALQSNGFIVVAGFTDDGVNKDAFLCRFKTDGTLDSTFGANGKVITDFDSSRQDEIHAVQIHPLTGKIVVAGNSIINTTKAKPVVARFLSNGQADSSFNGTGIRTLWVTSLDYQYYFSAEDLCLYANGKIAVAGWRDFPAQLASSNYWCAMLNSDGTMDNTFSVDGVAVLNGTFNGHDRAYSIFLNSSGNLLLGGSSHISTLYYDAGFFELNATGATTGTDGYISTASLTDDMGYAIQQDANNSYVLAGSAMASTSSSFLVARLTAAGSVDNTFGTNGYVTTNFGTNTQNEAFDMKLQTDGKIVAVGYSGNSMAIARYIGTPLPVINSLQLLTPTNNSTNLSYTYLILDMADAYLATGYEVQLDTFSNFSTAQTFPVVNSAAAVSNLKPLKTYYWKARATDGTNWGNWTNAWSFTTEAEPNSVSAVNIQSQLMLYPNPVKDQLVIQATQPGKGEIKDLAGRLVMRVSWMAGQTSVDVSSLQAGIYFLQSGKYSGSLRWVRDTK